MTFEIADFGWDKGLERDIHGAGGSSISNDALQDIIQRYYDAMTPTQRKSFVFGIGFRPDRTPAFDERKPFVSCGYNPEHVVGAYRHVHLTE